MLVLLLRHGPAGNADSGRWPDDRDRPLTSLGKKRTRRAARGIVALAPDLEAIWTSPLQRARDTAALVARAYTVPPPVVVLDALAPGGDVLPEFTKRGPRRVVLLVGHEPTLGLLAGQMLARAGLALAFKKAGGCAIDFNGEPRRGAGTLEWFLPPRLLRQLAKRAIEVEDE